MRGKDRKKGRERKKSEFNFCYSYKNFHSFFFRLLSFFYFFKEPDVLNINSVTEQGTELPKCEHCGRGNIIMIYNNSETYYSLDNVL